jgi:hypothetical protein
MAGVGAYNRTSALEGAGLHHGNPHNAPLRANVYGNITYPREKTCAPNRYCYVLSTAAANRGPDNEIASRHVVSWNTGEDALQVIQTSSGARGPPKNAGRRPELSSAEPVNAHGI